MTKLNQLNIIVKKVYKQYTEKRLYNKFIKMGKSKDFFDYDTLHNFKGDIRFLKYFSVTDSEGLELAKKLSDAMSFKSFKKINVKNNNRKAIFALLDRGYSTNEIKKVLIPKKETAIWELEKYVKKINVTFQTMNYGGMIKIPLETLVDVYVTTKTYASPEYAFEIISRVDFKKKKIPISILYGLETNDVKPIAFRDFIEVYGTKRYIDLKTKSFNFESLIHDYKIFTNSTRNN